MTYRSPLAQVTLSLSQKLVALSTAVLLIASVSLPQAIADSSVVPGSNSSEPQPEDKRRLSMSDGSNLGIGMLRAKDDNLAISSWLEQTQIVLFDRPQGQGIGKLEKGLLKRNGQSDQILNSPPLFALYSTYVFPVLEKRQNEWFRIRYQVGQGNDRTAWIKASQFQKAGVILDYESWQDYIMTKSSIEPIKNNQYVYLQPTARSQPLAKIKAGYAIEPLQVKGDWLKIRYSSNVQACGGLEEAPKKPKIFTGWMRWRKDGKFLIYIPEKGC
jgi:hypothetical protein